MNQLKGIFIDVKNREVGETILPKRWTAIAPKIGCDYFCCPYVFKNNDTLFADDEALLKEELEGGFLLENFAYPIVGNALVLGCDAEGNSIDCKTTIEEIRAQIKFVGKLEAEIWRMKAMAIQ